MLKIMGPKLEEFEVLSTIGSGAHGTVRKVRHLDGQVLVWKELNYGAMSESEKQGLVLEVNLLRELRHPNIVKFLHHIVDRRSTTLYILMEYCPGGDLKHLISKCRQTSTFLEEGFIWRVLKQICEALKVCHTRQLRGGRIILHRDIKPANVFLDADGEVKLGDFGLARTLNSEASFATTFVGTPYYMSPEVIEGQDYNEKSDMWSLGCLIYELCALHPPFQATTHKQLASKIREARYERIPMQYSSALQEVLGLLLTYEDFLRPTAHLVLHHSALVARTTSDKDRQEDDSLYHSLSHTVLLSAANPPRKLDVVEDADDSKDKRSFETRASKKVEEDGKKENADELLKESDPAIERDSSNNSRKLNKIDVFCRDEAQANHTKSDTYSMKETYRISKRDDLRSFSDAEEHKFSGCQDKLVPNEKENEVASITTYLPQEKKIKLPQKRDHTEPLGNTIDKICNAARNVGPVPERGSIDINLAKLACACGGMSPKSWRERILTLRESELTVREREVALQERERDVTHREHRVAAMEKEARQHLVRAQIYLRQSRPRQNAATSPHRPTSDLDTTVSADPGDGLTTTTKLDPQRISNPFLKMRGIQPPPEKRVSFKEKPTKFKSNTLDNPKSRLKRGNIFRLAERSSESKKESKDKVQNETNCRVPLKATTSNVSSVQHQGQEKTGESPLQSAPLSNLLQCTQETVSMAKPGLAYVLRERPRSTENLSKKSCEAGLDKENVGQTMKSKKVPEIKRGLWSRRSEMAVVWRTLLRISLEV
nr:serine/threonine-protein kinase Nek2-like isoform X2 [Procambarus clarkii]